MTDLHFNHWNTELTAPPLAVLQRRSSKFSIPVTDLDFNHWNTELTAPPLQGCQRLCDYLPADLQEEFLGSAENLRALLSYTWHLQEHFKKAARWAKAAVLARQARLPASFFIDALRDAYDHDRSLLAAKATGSQPVRRKDIPDRLTRSIVPPPDQVTGLYSPPAVVMYPEGRFISNLIAPPPETINYRLVEKGFVWDQGTPPKVVDAVVSLLETAPPDRLWIAEYEAQQSRKYDPIIYAVYGSWHVEVARWD